MKIFSLPRRSASIFRWIAVARGESGQDMIEYGLVAAIVAVGVIASVRSIQTAIVNAAYNGIGIVMSSF